MEVRKIEIIDKQDESLEENKFPILQNFWMKFNLLKNISISQLKFKDSSYKRL